MQGNILTINDRKCVGCAACEQICPCQAIDMREDEEGFVYPAIKEDLCINCGRCVNVCPLYQERGNANLSRIQCYSARNRDDAVLMKSSSGGIFYELAKVILKREGMVFGASYDKSYRVVHVGIDKEEDLDKLLGSKYVQSDLRNIYSEVKMKLESEKTILFSGTPCQIEGLYSYLAKDYPNLYCVDIICHGVPSPKLWEKYINNITNNREKKLAYVSFRDKSYSWQFFSLKISYEDGKVKRNSLLKDDYLRIFLKDYCLRPSCYECQFKGVVRKADITLGDYWGVDKIHPSVYSEKGVSALIVHSPKGLELVEEIQNRLFIYPTMIESIIAGNSALIQSSKCPDNREEFIRDMNAMDYTQLTQKYVPVNFTIRIKDFAAFIIGKFRIKSSICRLGKKR